MFDLILDPRPILAESAGPTIKDALAAINASGRHMAVVVDDDGKLTGVVTDGNVRRALLAGRQLSDPIEDLVRHHPVMLEPAMTDEEMAALLDQHGIDSAPVICASGKPIRIAHLRDVHHLTPGFGGAVIMAGGEGRRLLPLTKDLPKPLIEVGGRPLIEHIVRQLSRAGIEDVHVSVNYLAEKIKGRLGDGSALGTRISYLEERSKLGTAGALSLLPADSDQPLLVMNGDIMTNSDFQKLLAFHRHSKAAITVCVVRYVFTIPYGVFEVENDRVVGLLEKPDHQVPINAGIYVIEPRLLAMVPRDRPYDMTNLIDDCLAAGEPVVPFLIHEQWMDIGNPRDLETARSIADDVLHTAEAHP